MADGRYFSFEILAEREPGTLLRVLELFSVNSAVPATVLARKREDGLQDIVLEVDGLSAERAEVIAAKIGQIVTVAECRCVEKNLAASVVAVRRCA